MTTQVANTRMTLGALLGMVTTAASAATNLMSVANDGIDMLQDTVHSAKEQQLHRSKVDDIVYKKSYIEQAAQVRAGQVMAIQEFRRKSTDHASAFDAVMAEITEGLNPKAN